MRSRIAGVLAALILAGGPAAGLADEAEASRLLVEAVRLAEEAMRAPRDEAVALYERAAANLDIIAAEHPDSPYAPLILTNQPIGSFLPWQVRHELARLTVPAEVAPTPAPPPVGPCGGPCVWERQFGDGTGNILSGDGEAFLLADAMPRSDGATVIVGSRWAKGVREVWLAALDAFGEMQWWHTYPGFACDAAPIDGGFVVLAEKPADDTDTGVLVLTDDGTRRGTIGVDYQAFGVAADSAGGFLVFGRTGWMPIVESYRADGSLLWTWSSMDYMPADGGAATATAAVATADGIRVLGYQLRPDTGNKAATLWTATLDADGTMRLVAGLADFTLFSERSCDYVSRDWSIDALGPDAVIRYTKDDGRMWRATTVLRLDAAGAVIWSRTHPILSDAPPTPEDAAIGGVDEITAVSTTPAGEVLVAGYRNRPGGVASAGFVAGWDGNGEEQWRSEIRRVGAGEQQWFTYFAAVEQTSDAGVVAVMTDGMQTFRIRAFVLHLGTDGATP